MQKIRQVTVYFVGETAEEAFEGMLFDSYESADSYRMDQGVEAEGYLEIFSVDLFPSLSDLTQE